MSEVTCGESPQDGDSRLLSCAYPRNSLSDRIMFWLQASRAKPPGAYRSDANPEEQPMTGDP